MWTNRLRRAASALVFLFGGQLALRVEAQEVSPSDIPALVTEADPGTGYEEFVLQPSSRPAPSLSPNSGTAARGARRPSRTEYAQLARMPNMFGDSLGMGGQLVIPAESQSEPVFFGSDVPLGVGASYKVGENMKPLPVDRVYFIYNGFKNALNEYDVTGAAARGVNVDRYTAGFEKTFFDGTASIDVRMPFVGGFETASSPDNSISSDIVGDLSMFLKQLVFATDQSAVAVGLGIGLPTSNDVTMILDGFASRIRTQSVHLMPYVGGMHLVNDKWFVQGYLQLDFAASGNPVESEAPFELNGVLTDQTLFHVDASIGRWLYQADDARYLTGIAAVTELHYTTTLQDADIVGRNGNFLETILGNQYNRLDFLNLTAGLHFQIGQLSNMRVGCVMPLKTDEINRQFDSEVQVSFNRYF